MKKLKRTLVVIFATVLLCSVAVSVSAVAADTAIEQALSYCMATEQGDVVIRPQTARDGKWYLFLPANADYSSLPLTFGDDVDAVELSANGAVVSVVSGQATDVTPLLQGDAEHPVTVSLTVDGASQSYQLILMKSENVRSLYFVSDDPVNFGRDYVDASKDNEEASGMAMIVNADGELDYDGVVKEIKGRGNTTFEKFTKKPYQIKLDKKAELVDGGGKSKKWVLLANAADPAFIRNSITFDAAAYLNLPYPCANEVIDFYYDGEYRGTYLLSEKVEVDDNRVEISNTDDLIEDANLDTPAYDNPSVVSVSRKDGTTPMALDGSGSFRYVEKLIEPAFPEGASHHAYLLEFELEARYPDELTGFVTDRAQRIVTKTPEYLTYDQGMYIANFWQEFEDAVYSKDGYNAATGKYYYDYCDLDSLVNAYVLNEFVKNCDYYESSTFFYLAENSDKFVCGPLWDYDLAYGTGYDLNRESVVTKPEYFYSAAKPFAAALMKIESFRNAVQQKMSADGEVQALRHLICDEGGWIDTYAAEIAASQAMNYKLWDICNADVPAVSQPAGTTFDSAIAGLKNFISVRADWLTEQTAQWSGDNYTIQTEPEPEETNPILEFFEMILDFFRTIIDWFEKLFNALG